MDLFTKISIASVILLLLIATGYILALKYLSVPPNGDKNGLYGSTGQPVTREPISLTLNLNNPDDNLLVNSPNLLIQGKTLPNIVVILTQNTDDLVLQSSLAGDFSTTITLAEGVNQFNVAVFDDKGNSKIEGRTVFYSKEKI